MNRTLLQDPVKILQDPVEDSIQDLIGSDPAQDLIGS